MTETVEVLVNRPAEQRLLGSCLNNAAAVEKVAAKLGPGDFSDRRLGTIFSAIARVALRDTPTPTTVVEELRAAGELEDVGGDRALIFLGDMSGVSMEETMQAAKTIRELAGKRDALEAARRLVGTLSEGKDATEDLAAITAVRSDGDGWEDLQPVIDAIYAGTHQRLEPTMLTRTDGSAILYEARLNWIAGAPESMKSWLAKYTAVEQMRKGRPVIYIDFEEQDGTTCAERIFSIATGLGVDRETLAEWMAGPVRADGTRDGDGRLFFYRAESSGFTNAARAQALAVIKSRAVPFVVLDGFAAAIASHEPPLSEDNSRDVNLFLAGLVWPMVSAGAGVLIIDHVTKAAGQQGQTAFQQRAARGSGAKLAAVSGVMLIASVVKAGSAWLAGEVELWVAKDRPGRIKVAHRSGKRLAGMLTSTPVSDGVVESTRIEIKSPDQLAEEAAEKRWDLIAAEKVSRLLEASAASLSKSEVKETLNAERKERGGAGWRGETLVAAIRFLTDNGWVTGEKDGRSEMLASVKAYRSDFGDVHANDAPATTHGAGFPSPMDSPF